MSSLPPDSPPFAATESAPEKPSAGASDAAHAGAVADGVGGSVALERAERVESRLVALQELGCDVAAPLAELIAARERLHAGALVEASALIDAAAEAAARLAESERRSPQERSGRFAIARPERCAPASDIAAAVARAVADHAVTEVMLEARLNQVRCELTQLIARELAPTREALATAQRTLAAVQEAQARAEPAAPRLNDTEVARRLDGLRADFSWEVEKIAAERGWCSLSDVESVIARSNSPAGGLRSTPDFSRLEAALAEFVRQTISQQQQFIVALQDRFEQGTALLMRQVASGVTSSFSASARATALQQSSRERADSSHETGHGHETGHSTPDHGDSAFEAVDTAAVAAAAAVLAAQDPTLRHTTTRSAGAHTGQDGAAQAESARHDAAPAAEIAPAVGDTTPTEPAPQLPQTGRATVPLDTATAFASSGSSASRPALVADRQPERPAGGFTSLLAAVAAPVEDPSEFAAQLDQMPEEAPHLTPTCATGPLPARPVPAAAAASGAAVSSDTDLAIPLPSDQPRVGTEALAPHALRSEIDPDQLRSLVAAEVARALAAERAAAPQPPGLDLASVQDLIHLELDRSEARIASAQSHPVTPGLDRSALLDLLPDLLAEPAVAQRLFALICMEAIESPGALGELTGLRRFLRDELALAAVPALR